MIILNIEQKGNRAKFFMCFLFLQSLSLLSVCSLIECSYKWFLFYCEFYISYYTPNWLGRWQRSSVIKGERRVLDELEELLSSPPARVWRRRWRRLCDADSVSRISREPLGFGACGKCRRLLHWILWGGICRELWSLLSIKESLVCWFVL